MKNKVFSIFIMLFIVLFAVNVKANSIYDIRPTIEKGDNSGELYNAMPTDVKKGDIIAVTYRIKDARGWEANYGVSNIVFDQSAFEPVEVNGKFYKKTGDDYVRVYYEKGGKIYLQYYIGDVITENNKSLVELYFKVKNNVNDGVYSISQINGSLNISVNGNNYDDGDEDIDAYSCTLQYQVGKPKLKSIYTKDSIGKGNYVIGNYLFTRNKNDVYDGVLSTEHIMLASKTIESNNKNDMVIYAKTAKGEWHNAITDDSITPPSEFDIEYVDMKENYRKNGFYVDSTGNTLFEMIQISDTEAIITLENDKEEIHGIASVNNNVLSFSVSSKNYQFIVSDNEVNITTNDSYITNKKLQKVANYSMDEYINRTYAGYSDEAGPSYYVKSSQSGRYTFGNYELYFVRTGEGSARICIKEKNADTCAINDYIFNDDYSIYFDESAYTLSFDESEYGFDFIGENIEIKFHGNTQSPYAGLYTKQSTIGAEDIVRLFENSYHTYVVTIDDNNGAEDAIYHLHIPIGMLVTDENFGWPEIEEYVPELENHTFKEWQVNGVKYNFNTPVTSPLTIKAKYDENPKYTVTFETGGGTTIASQTLYKGKTVTRPATDPQKDGYTFIEWQLNGSAYDFTTPVTANITLVAKWQNDIPTPQISFAMGDDTFAMGLLILNEDDYCSGVCNGSSTDEHTVDGYIVYKKNGSTYIPVLTQYYNQSEQTFVRNLNDEIEDETYVVRMFIENNGSPMYSDDSNELVLHANENGSACYLHEDTYVWGHFRGMEGYVKRDGKNGIIECIGPAVCYRSGNNYEWTDEPQDGWEVDQTITNESDCHAPVVPTIASCPGCKFMYTTNTYQYGGASNANATSVSTLTGVTDDYTTLNKNYFLGFTETQDGKIDRAFACGIKGENPNQGTAFCIEGGSFSTNNETLLNNLYGPYDNQTELGCTESGTSIQCNGVVSAYSQLAYGDVNVNTDDVNCSVNSDYSMHCFEY